MSKKNMNLKPLEKASVGTIVWAKLGSYNWWPAIIIKSSDCGQPEAKIGNLWLFWFGDHKISELSRKRIVEFTVHFCQMYTGISKKHLRNAVFEALEVLARRSSCDVENNEALISWAKKGFQGLDEALISRNDLPISVLKHLERLQKSKASGSNDASCDSDYAFEIFNSNIPLKMVREGLLKIEDMCIACYEKKEEIVDQHPFYNGGLCSECKVRLQENMFACGNDGKSMCCSICVKPGSLILCDRNDCQRSFCIDCITLLLGPDEQKKIMETDPWYCFFCLSNDGCGLLQIKSDWEDRIITFFQPPGGNENEFSRLDFGEKRPLRVLSLFDGISTGKLVLDSLGLDIEVYFASEIDENAINVSKINHKNSISYIGDVTELTDDKISSLAPIDLVIGGSPCNDLSLVNPVRKGIFDFRGTGQLFFDFFFILNSVQRFNKEHNVKQTFFLYENVAAMSILHKCIISTSLRSKPALIDAKYFSPQIRPRYFWGNIPGLHMLTQYCSSSRNGGISEMGYEEENLLDHYLLKNLGRNATVEKIRTVTTQRNSLIQSNSTLPVEMNGAYDVLWVTELEQIFGFPKHYTDTGNLNVQRRRELLGRSWSVPVIKAILRPLKTFFKTKDN